VNTLEDLAEVKRVVVEVAKDAAVLNADDVHCLQMADHCTADAVLRDHEPQSSRWCASTSRPAARRWCWSRASTAT
jgi:hypothetical protein